jgi:drug/metabolite transporter (DMT)-like permease
MSAVTFGSAGIFVKNLIVGDIDSINIIILQYLIALPLMFLYIVIIKPRYLLMSRYEVKHLFILGGIGNTFMTLFYYEAFSLLPMGIVTLLLYMSPIFVFMYTLFWEKSKVTKTQLIALVLVLIGGILTLIPRGQIRFSFKGIIYGLLSAAFFAFMNSYSSKKLKNTEGLKINFYATLFSLLTLIAINPSFFKQDLNFSYEILFNLGVLALFCEIAPLVLFYIAIKKIGSVNTSIVGCLEIPVSIIGGFIFLKETFLLIHIFGALIIVAATLLLNKETI